MKTSDLISKAKYNLYKGFPFFAYLVEHLNIKEDNKCPTIGVDGKGNVYYNAKWVDSICQSDNIKILMGVLAHEALHLVFEHPKRMKGRNVVLTGVDEKGNAQSFSLWNIAGDIYINNIIMSNYRSHKIENLQLELPKEGILPENNKVTWNNITINDISSKTTEEIYDELKAGVGKQLKENKNGEGNCLVSGFDEHLDWDKADSQDNKINEKTQGKDWKKILAEANAHAQQRGEMPLGMEREINDIHKSRINWKHYLQKVITNSIPQDYTWSKPNKKYIGQDIYLPSIFGESIRVLFYFDTSGSMSPQDLTDSMSEIIGISKCYSNIEFRALTGDTKVQEDIEVYNGNIKKLKKLKMLGNGGSSLVDAYKYIKDKRYNVNTKLMICFTDGYIEFPEKLTIPTIFVLVGNHVAKKDMPKKSLAIIEIN